MKHSWIEDIRLMCTSPKLDWQVLPKDSRSGTRSPLSTAISGMKSTSPSRISPEDTWCQYIFEEPTGAEYGDIWCFVHVAIFFLWIYEHRSSWRKPGIQMWPKRSLAEEKVCQLCCEWIQWISMAVERTFRMYFLHLVTLINLMQFTEAVALLACLVFQKHFQML